MMQMDHLIAEFPAQFRRAEAISESNPLVSPFDFRLRNLTIFGMGGSAFGGELFKNLTENSASVPVEVRRSYGIPRFIDKDSLCVICSYSGNTEETLHAAESARSAGATVVSIASGGALKTWSAEHNLPFIEIPGGYPPRTAFAFTFTQLLHVGRSFGLIPDMFPDLERAVVELEKRSESVKKEAQNLSENLKGSTPVIYSDDVLAAVALRWRQQIAENAKILCWHHTLPEMNHNELVGWEKETLFYGCVQVLMLKSESFLHDRTRHHYNFLLQYLREKNIPVAEIIAPPSDHLLTDILHLIHFGDYFSYFWSLKNEVDPVEVNVIGKLKKYLSDQP